MAFVNFATREITAKIVYYGPGLGGKTTSLQYIHNGMPPENRGKMISLATEEDRTIYFDFLPLHLGKIQDFAVRVQLYTVPGQVRYNATRKLVLRGADGLVFVADSQRHRKLSNLESFRNMEDNLREHGKDLKDLPHILQFNKIDLPNRVTVDELNLLLNKYNIPFFETCATSGAGILDALKTITKLVFNDLGKKALLQKKVKTAAGTVAPGVLAEAPAPRPAPAAKPTLEAAAPASPAVSKTASRIEPEPVAAELSEPWVKKPQKVYTRLETQYSEMKIEPAKSEEHALSTIEPPRRMEASEEVEPMADFDAVETEITYDDYTEPTVEKTNYSFLKDSIPRFSYEELFDAPPEFRSLMEILEKQIVQDERDSAISTSKSAYSMLLTKLFPKEYIMDGNESSIILALSIKFKRFLRFKRLLESGQAQPRDLLFLHHFLSDLYLSIKEL